jgi:hypothetical protein
VITFCYVSNSIIGRFSKDVDFWNIGATHLDFLATRFGCVVSALNASYYFMNSALQFIQMEYTAVYGQCRSHIIKPTVGTDKNRNFVFFRGIHVLGRSNLPSYMTVHTREHPELHTQKSKRTQKMKRSSRRSNPDPLPPRSIQSQVLQDKAAEIDPILRSSSFTTDESEVVG